jgi:hypothetical protein
LGNETVTIKLITKAPLRLLDFHILGQSYLRPSYFQPDFEEQLERGEFISQLQRRISDPVVPGRESEYIITQTLAEYLAHVHAPPFDGILFDSAQRHEGKNVVLFPGVDDSFPLAYVESSVTAYTTCRIEYEHDELPVYLSADGELSFYNPEEEQYYRDNDP